MNVIRDTTSTRTWSTARELADHIESVHHGYLRLTLPVLDRLSEQIARQHLVPPTLMDRLQRQFVALADLLETHIAKQECLVFPKIRHLREPAGELCWACRLDDGLDDLMDRQVLDNRESLAMLQQLETCLTDSHWAGKGPVVNQFVQDIHELHQDFTDHAHLETDVLFPHVHELLQPSQLAV